MTPRFRPRRPKRPPTKKWFAFLLSESFLEKLALLIVTALLTGLVMPQFIKRIDEGREARASVARAQAKLFEDVSETILTYETLALDVSWYGTKDANNPAMQMKAFERYSERVVELVSRWRTEVSRAQTLASPEVAKAIDSHLTYIFSKQDSPMVAMWSCKEKCKSWDAQHVANEQALAISNRLIARLAKELGLENSPPVPKAP